MNRGASPNYLERGRLLNDHRRWLEAAEAFRQHLSAYPGDAVAFAMLSIALASAGPATGSAAVAASDEAMRLDANDSYILYARAIVSVRTDVPLAESELSSPPGRSNVRRRLLVARRFATMAVEHNPNFLPAWQLLSRIAWGLNEPVVMRATAEAVLQRSPNDVAAMALLAQALEIEGRPGEALAAAEDALEFAADDANLHSVRAWALLQAGKDADAERGFIEALRVDPTNQINQLGLRDAQHNQRVRASSSVRRFFFSETERRPRSNNVKAKVGSSAIIVVGFALGLASNLSKLAPKVHSHRVKT